MLGDFPAQWTRRGIVFHLRAHRELIGNDPLETTNPDAIVLRWHELRELAAIDPWPRFRVRWRGAVGGSEHELGPARGTIETLLSPARAPEAFAERVRAMFDHVATYAAHAVRRGWLDVAEVEWEQVERMPEVERPGAALGEGAFRSTSRTVEERAIAARTPNTAIESMMQWLASTPERPWRQHPREVRLSAEHLYALRRDRTIWRLPLEALRARIGAADEDALYVFGRRTSIVLAAREGCPVRAELDARLETGGSE